MNTSKALALSLIDFNSTSKRHKNFLLCCARNYKEHLDRRLTETKHPIERAYLLFESACNDLFNDSLDYCKQFAVNAEAEALSVGSHIFTFLSVMMQLKAEISAGNIERQADHLKRLQDVVKPLRCERLEHLIVNGIKVIGSYSNSR